MLLICRLLFYPCGAFVSGVSECRVSDLNDTVIGDYHDRGSGSSDEGGSKKQFYPVMFLSLSRGIFMPADFETLNFHPGGSS